MDEEFKSNLLDFNDACAVGFITNITFSYDTSVAPPNLKPLPDSLKFPFLGPDESLSMTTPFNLDQDQEGRLLTLPRENEKALGWTLGT